jgi:class 3 adenylate cyclase
MEALGPYLATDRRSALAESRTLAERSEGAALFADVSGFTALTEALANSLGPRRGAEELSAHLNSVYEALIEVIHRFDGSVIAFAGDAITCWFDSDQGDRAAAAALELQNAMRQFAEIRLADGQVRSLAVKTGVARGPVCRFLVGNPDVHLLDVIAGKTLARMADATSLASKEETIFSTECVEALGDRLEIKEWRTKKDTGEKFAVAGQLQSPHASGELPGFPLLSEALLRPHLLKPVYDRLRAGKGDFLTELRPAVALFLKFEGLDYDSDPGVGTKLNNYVQWVQGVVDKLGGFLLAVSMGDKGSFLYCCFGAPVAYENSASRAMIAADELRKLPPNLQFITQTRIGVSSGTLRTGAYGATVRRTYGVLGDPVNLAARLMEHAAPGQVLVSGDIRRDTRQGFEWQTFAPIKAKAKASPSRCLPCSVPRTPAPEM